MADEKEKKEPVSEVGLRSLSEVQADNCPEFFWNYLTKNMRLKLGKWTKMITTNEFRRSLKQDWLNAIWTWRFVGLECNAKPLISWKV
ncbi:GM11109 [Drosophila sechellia]|uniref:GM11109 n=1 Tax=Drosophila sechellia TaxID=7238 RepID=B4INT7_DROSE|nr:GM11109 [Drosophila sechellia]